MKKALLELDNRIIFQPDFNVDISPKNETKHPVAEWHDHAKHTGLNSIFVAKK